MTDIAIIGLGPVGSALGVALKAGVSEATITGFDPDKANAAKAAAAGAVDEVRPNAAQAVAGAQLIILATPLAATRDVLRIVGEFAPTGCVVTDACPLKAPVLRWAEEFLPPSLDFVGGHPVLKPASFGAPSPLQGADYCIVPSKATPADAVEAVIGLASAVGAKPFFIEAAEHDSYVIATEYLPRIAASAAIHAASTGPVWRDVRRLWSETFQDAVMAAELDPHEMAIILEYAPEALLSWVERLSEATGELRALAYSKPGVEEARERLAAFEKERHDRLSDAPAADGPVFERQGFSSLLLGDWLNKRARRGLR